MLGELREGMVVLGIGVNVNQTREQLPPETRQLAGSLRTLTGRAHDREAVLATLLLRLERHYDAWLGGGLAALYADIGARDFLRGRRVRVDGLSGTVVGIDRTGRLELNVDGERRAGRERRGRLLRLGLLLRPRPSASAPPRSPPPRPRPADRYAAPGRADTALASKGRASARTSTATLSARRRTRGPRRPRTGAARAPGRSRAGTCAPPRLGPSR